MEFFHNYTQMATNLYVGKRKINSAVGIEPGDITFIMGILE